MTVRVDEAGHEQLLAVAEDARAGIFALQVAKSTDFGDAPGVDGDGTIPQHALFLLARIGEQVPAAHEQRRVHRLRF